MALLYSKAFYISREGLKLFWGRVSRPTQRKSPFLKYPLQNLFCFLLFPPTIESSRGGADGIYVILDKED